MSFQLPTTTAGAGGGFSFGANTAGAQPAKPTFSFGATGGGDAGAAKPLSFGFGGAAATSTAPATSTPSLGGGTSFGFGTPAATTATTTAATTGLTTGGFGGFGAAPAAAATTASTTTASAATQPAATAPLTSGFSFGAPTAANTTAQQTSSNTGTGLTTATAASTAATATLTSKPATTTGGFASLTTATKTTDSSAVANASQLTYNQLEEHINKWTLELEEQEKVFTDQATQINAWDKVLISNNQKILDLNDAVQKVKADQQTLEQELEFIATQHKELEESIVPLQKEFMKIPQVDVERSQTYLMVENLDTQLKQMSEDLKEIIDNLNESNKCQDNTDPIIQIGKILNAHMSSLQWIEQSTSNIGNKLEDITKMHETFKRDSERSFRSAYYN
ncbi:nucleoporin 62 [Musca autumnalis]|uniref:nucleoporin 62 n=1 Tax=Musca autumnalis TaxID=221902 RepID=UPI003CF8AFF2